MRLCRSLYAYYHEEELVILAGAHVDDIMWAAKPEFEFVITEKLFSHFQLNHIHENKFRFCGRDYEQDSEGTVTITCRNNIEKILPIKYDRRGRKADDRADVQEISQGRSVIGSLAWIARQARPEYCYSTSRLQSVIAQAKFKHIQQCNQVLQDVQATSNIGIVYLAKKFDFAKGILISLSDASWANDEKIIDDHIFPRRSQYGRINCIGNEDLWDGTEGTVHFIGWKSGLIKRLCRSTVSYTHLRAHET